MPSRRVQVTEAQAGMRLDVCLAEALQDLSRAQIKRLIDAGAVTGPARKAGDHVQAGWEFEIDVPEPRSELEPQDVEFRLVYSDDDVVVVDKPAGLVVHPAPGNYDGTLVHGVLARVGTLATLGGPLRPGIVHRLDKDTSGLLVVARSDAAYKALVQQISGRHATRGYTAIVCGRMPEARGTIEAAIGRSHRDRKLMRVDHRGRSAATHYRVTGAAGPCDVLDLRLESGRTHQIRVHLRHLGRPVLGDPTYGGRGGWVKSLPVESRRSVQEALRVLKRQALHASILKFEHPRTGEPMEFVSELPHDIRTARDILQA